MEFSHAWRFNESSLRTQGPIRRDLAFGTVTNALRSNKQR
jgi:hypothetical protein